MIDIKSMEKALASFDGMYNASTNVSDADFVFHRISFIWKRVLEQNLFCHSFETIINGNNTTYRESTGPSSDMIGELNGVIDMITRSSCRNGIELVFEAPIEVIKSFKSNWPGYESYKSSVPFFRDRGSSLFIEEGFEQGTILSLHKDIEWRNELSKIIMSDFSCLILRANTNLLTEVEISNLIKFRDETNIFDFNNHIEIMDYRDMFLNVKF